MARALAVAAAVLVAGVLPALAAEQSTQALVAQRIAFGVTLAGGLIFFAWVAWLASRR